MGAGRYDEWADRAASECGDDPLCWEDFMWSSANHAKSTETARRIKDAFLHQILPRLVELSLDSWYEEYGVDLVAWRTFFEKVPEVFRDIIAEHVATYLKERIEEAIQKALKDPEARKMYRPYMHKLTSDIIAGYLEGLSQREIAERAGYALHSVWNTTWWTRKYAKVDLWPARGG